MSGRKKDKSTDAQVALRVSEVIDCLLSGATRREILQYAAKNEWDMGARTIDYYIARAWASVEESVLETRERSIRKHLARREMLFARCVMINDYRTALQVARDHAQLIGLYPAEKHEHTGKDGRELPAMTFISTPPSPTNHERNGTAAH